MNVLTVIYNFGRQVLQKHLAAFCETEPQDHMIQIKKTKILPPKMHMQMEIDESKHTQK